MKALVPLAPQHCMSLYYMHTARTPAVPVPVSTAVNQVHCACGRGGLHGGGAAAADPHAVPHIPGLHQVGPRGGTGAWVGQQPHGWVGEWDGGHDARRRVVPEHIRR